jgi:hypothetical protein
MPRRTRPAALLAAFAGALALGGCGLGAGPGTTNAHLSVTEDFGTRTIGQVTQKRVPGSETVMQLLERNFRVTTRYGGGFVESIDGHSGNSNRNDWFYYVNGIEAAKGAASTAVHQGDQIWWDRHDWSATDTIPAVVGSFPEPFTNGTGGKQLPTVLDCAPDVGPACSSVGRALDRAHVRFAYQSFGGGSGSDSLAIVVGTWRDVHGVIAGDLVASGPRKSGVYAQFVGPGGQVLELENPKGQVVQTLRAGAGLVAATEQASLNEPTWLVTGTDPAGVAAAAAALSPARLHDHFALAVAAGRDLPLPLSPAQ